MKTTDDMVRLNKDQAKFYDAIQEAEAEAGHGGYAENESANVLTRAWAGLRYRQQAAVKEAGIEARMKEVHARWVASKAGGRFLELGCFSGSPSTFLLAGQAGEYLGVELSPKAVESLNAKFAAQGLAHKARAAAVDFLTFSSPEKFDLVYAHGVLHHFENPDPLFDRILDLLKPDGVLLMVEPCAVNPVYRIIRAAYRPLQSDAAWEWPFSRRTVGALESRLAPVEGFGWGRFSLPFSVLTGLPLLGGLFKPLYLRLARAEVAAGWHDRVWHNSMITSLWSPRPDARRATKTA
jgi:SAM-dependent methyltransferase